MEPKQLQIEHLVTDYFRHRVDTDISHQGMGVYEVRLNSPAARQHFGDTEQLSLVFDSEKLAVSPDSEVVTATHPFLDVIRDDLSSDPAAEPRLGEGHVVLQILDHHGHLGVPELIFSSNKKQVQYVQRFIPTFVLTYRVTYDTDERSENVVRLCYSAVSGKLESSLLSEIQELSSIADGHPSDTETVEYLGLDRILQAGRLEIESRVSTDVKALSSEIGARLEGDKKRLRVHYEAELAKLRTHDIVGRQRLEERQKKDIQELERKYECRVKVQLLSVLKLWWPIVDYTVIFQGGQKTLSIEGIVYDSQAGQIKFRQCGECGNRVFFDVCIVGQHVTCGGDCSHGISECAICHDLMCPGHGGPCHHCGHPVCQDDRQACSYGRHDPDTYFCPECLVDSFENKPLCTDCLQYCESCQRPFAHEHISTCRLGGEHICLFHGLDPCGYQCEECSQTTCETHGQRTCEDTWVCTDHGATASCCGEFFAQSRLETCCVEQNELLCPDHRFYCAGCGHAVCESHSSALHMHPRKRVCDNCRVTCELCSPTRNYLSTDLTECVACGKAVCAAHRQICAVCGDTICEEHAALSAKGEYLCPTHTGICMRCESGKEIHCKEELQPCIVCGDLLCLDHRSECADCDHAVCETHSSELHKHPGRQVCDNCRITCDLCEPTRSYLSQDLARCMICGNAVCIDHRHTCAVCNDMVCQAHTHVSTKGEFLCPSHSGTCQRCPPDNAIHRRQALRPCIICGLSVCSDHRVLCPVCQQTYMGRPHLGDLPRCASCGRISCQTGGCSTEAQTCPDCGMSYCQHCFTPSKRCVACASPKQMPVDQRIVDYLSRVRQLVPEQTRTFLDEMLENRSYLSWGQGQNQTYRVLVFHCRPPWYQFWKSHLSNRRFRMVVSNDGTIMRVKVESVKPGKD